MSEECFSPGFNLADADEPRSAVLIRETCDMVVMGLGKALNDQCSEQKKQLHWGLASQCCALDVARPLKSLCTPARSPASSKGVRRPPACCSFPERVGQEMGFVGQERVVRRIVSTPGRVAPPELVVPGSSPPPSPQAPASGGEEAPLQAAAGCESAVAVEAALAALPRSPSLASTGASSTTSTPLHAGLDDVGMPVFQDGPAWPSLEEEEEVLSPVFLEASQRTSTTSRVLSFEEESLVCADEDTQVEMLQPTAAAWPSLESGSSSLESSSSLSFELRSSQPLAAPLQTDSRSGAPPSCAVAETGCSGGPDAAVEEDEDEEEVMDPRRPHALAVPPTPVALPRLPAAAVPLVALRSPAPPTPIVLVRSGSLTPVCRPDLAEGPGTPVVSVRISLEDAMPLRIAVPSEPLAAVVRRFRTPQLLGKGLSRRSAAVPSQEKRIHPAGGVPVAQLAVVQDVSIWQPTARVPKGKLRTWPVNKAAPQREELAFGPARSNAWSPAKVLQEVGCPVYLHIYDVSQKAHIQWLNMVLAHSSSPVKWGGIFHVGVEVYGKEWSFGRCPSGSGVGWTRPGGHRDHHYRERVPLPATVLSEADVCRVIAELKKEYPGHTYHLFRRNCCKFAEDMCLRLGVGSLPFWVHRLSCVADSATYYMEGLREQANVMHLSRFASPPSPEPKEIRTCSGMIPRAPTEEVILPDSVPVSTLLRDSLPM